MTLLKWLRMLFSVPPKADLTSVGVLRNEAKRLRALADKVSRSSSASDPYYDYHHKKVMSLIGMADEAEEAASMADEKARSKNGSHMF